jgi:hypothetical protein
MKSTKFELALLNAAFAFVLAVASTTSVAKVLA